LRSAIEKCLVIIWKDDKSPSLQKYSIPYNLL
jgi:hypothetical protein